MTDPDTILLTLEESMEKALDYLKQELRGVRTGRASTAMVDFLKIEAYGSLSDLKNLAAIGVPEPTQILIKPFDTALTAAIRVAIEKSGLGVAPIVEGKQIRLNLPAMSADRRQKEAGRMKKMGEDTKVILRNNRRDANKHADDLKKNAAAHLSEDSIETLKEEIQNLLKKFEGEVDKRVEEKTKEVMTL